MTDTDTARTPPGSAYYLDRPLRSLAEVTEDRSKIYCGRPDCALNRGMAPCPHCHELRCRELWRQGRTGEKAARDLCDVAADISAVATTLRRLAAGIYHGYAEGTDTATLVRAAVHDMRQARGRLDGLIAELDEPAKGRVA